jgi:hypothetical protein
MFTRGPEISGPFFNAPELGALGEGAKFRIKTKRESRERIIRFQVLIIIC